MEGIGYWIFIAVLYLLSSLMKKRRQQAISQQQDKEDPNSTDEVKQNPFQAEFLQDLFRDMKDLVEDPEEITEDEINNIYVDELALQKRGMTRQDLVINTVAFNDEKIRQLMAEQDQILAF